MTESVLTQILLPAAIAIIMLGMGLSLTIADFTRLFRLPKAVATGLLGQLLLLPIVAFGLCFIFELGPEMAIGLMILAACPGGTMSNVISQLCRANLALSVTLTACCTLVGIITTPWLIAMAYQYFNGEAATDFSLVNASLSLMALTLIPIAIGMALRHLWQVFAERAEPYFRKGSSLFMLVMIIAILIQEKAQLTESFSQLFWVCLALNLLTILLGLALAKIQQLSWQDSLTLAIEIGIQNATLAILISLSFLSQSSLALPAGVYGITMFIGAVLLVIAAKIKLPRSESRLNSLS